MMNVVPSPGRTHYPVHRYSDYFTEDKAWFMGIRGYIPKSVAVRDLARLVRKVLDAC